MADIVDKVLLAGLGLEQQIKKKINRLAAEGKKATEEGLDVKEDVENKLVDEIVNIVGSAMKKVGVAKKEVDAAIGSLAEDLTDRLKIATADEIDVLEKLMSGMRSRLEGMEKRLGKIEKKMEEMSSGAKKK